MQSRWGTHGDHPIIVVTPSSVQEIYQQTIRAFNLSETYRVPVVVLYDEAIGHLVDTVDLPDPDSIEIHDRSGQPARQKATCLTSRMKTESRRCRCRVTVTVHIQRA